MGLLMTLLIGFIVGVIAKFLMPGRDPGGFIITILLGIAGAFVAGYLGQAFGLYRSGEPAGFLAAIVGAMILLFIYRLAVGRREFPR
ncbi:MAG: GlsB/YeaQ/YmgE family stress response membrane protein [Bdellovibrionaceae bacterium]|nr:GlsB/YeaQ/YmgE family stress response membrane protein [Pseudobdellovibrionaceae bacterium]